MKICSTAGVSKLRLASPMRLSRSLTAALLTLVVFVYNDVSWCRVVLPAVCHVSLGAGGRMQMPNFVL